MTFVQLQYLLEINRTGSVSQAAKNLFVSQSSVSIALNALEKELGFPIFARTRKGLLPTRQGANVIDQAAQICESHRLMTAPTEEFHTNVRIHGNASSMAQKAFLQLVKENTGRRDIYFSFTNGHHSYELLRNFNLEGALSMTMGPHYLSKEDIIAKNGLHAELLATLPGCIRLGKGHRLFDAPDVTIADLQNDLLLDTPNASVSEALLTAGILRIQPNHRISSMHHGVRKQLLLEGLAYEINYYLPNQPEPDYRYIPLEELQYKMIAVTNPLRPEIPELERFWELLRQELHNAGLREN